MIAGDCHTLSARRIVRRLTEIEGRRFYAFERRKRNFSLEVEREVRDYKERRRGCDLGGLPTTPDLTIPLARTGGARLIPA